MRAMLDQAAFLELSDDSVINADAAVAQLEDIAATLQELSADGRKQLVAFAHKMAEEERGRNDDSRRAQFLAGIGDQLGLE